MLYTVSPSGQNKKKNKTVFSFFFFFPSPPCSRGRVATAGLGPAADPPIPFPPPSAPLRTRGGIGEETNPSFPSFPSPFFQSGCFTNNTPTRRSSPLSLVPGSLAAVNTAEQPPGELFSFPSFPFGRTTWSGKAGCFFEKSAKEPLLSLLRVTKAVQLAFGEGRGGVFPPPAGRGRAAATGAGHLCGRRVLWGGYCPPSLFF